MQIVTTLGRVWISGPIFDFLTSEADEAMPHETGGILLGYFVQASTEAVVTHAIGSGPNAVHDLDRFIPDYDYQEVELARIYEESHRQISYLGDWHSHPRGTGDLSRSDRRTLRHIAECPDARVPEPLMVILTNGPGWIPVAWGGCVRPRLFWLPQFVTTIVSVEIFHPE